MTRLWTILLGRVTAGCSAGLLSRVFTCASALAAGLLLALGGPLSAAEPVALDALVAETVARNPELKFYEAEIAAARGGRTTAGEWANPQLSSDLGHKSVRDLDGHHIGDGPIWAVSISQTFEFPGRLSLRKALANGRSSSRNSVSSSSEQ